MLEKEKLDIKCPKCEKTQSETVAILTSVNEIKCRSCKAMIPIEASDLKKELSAAEEAIASFRKNLSKKIEIKF